MKNFSIRYLFFVILLGAGIPAVAQVTLSGTVKTPQGEAVIGANVLIRNTSMGTVTDINGQFNLQIGENFKDSSLMISSIGYATQQVAINNKTEFTIILAEDTKTLDEIVVTGYQSEERGKILGAVNSVSPDLLIKLPVSGIDQALQGRVPGVSITQNTGAPGEGVSVRIRGVGSINSSNQPLYIVDGIPTTDITSFSPQDIQTLTVLKDAGATAIYGARAANGVVLITTKSGTSNQQVVQISSQIGFQSPTRLVPMANTEQYANIYNEARNTDTTGTAKFLWRPLITDAMRQGLANVDQVKAIMRKNAVIQTHSITISGSEGKTRYLFSGSYFDQKGIIKGSDYNRITGRLNIDTEVKKWLRTGVNLNISAATTDLVGSSGDGAGGNGGSVVRYAYFRTPALPITDAQGNFVDKPQDYYTDNPSLYNSLFGDGYNPVGMLAYNNNKKISDRIFGKFFIMLKPIEGMTFTTNVGVDFTTQNQRRFDRNWGTGNRINNPNRLTVNDDRNHTLTWNNILEYGKSFEKHNVRILLGSEAIKTENYTIGSTDTNFANQSGTLTYLNNGLGQKTVSESRGGNALLSYFGKLSYDFNEKYLAAFTFRRDGSSRFGLNNRWGNFYAGSAGWRIDKEDFLSRSNVVDRLFLRGGFGVIGNQEIPNYEFSDQIGVNYNYPFGNTKNIGYAIAKLGNANIQWESSTQANIGLDFVGWGGKFSASVDLFNKVTSKELVTQSIASSSGSASPATINNGKVQNTGIELSITYANKIGDFRYSISPNAALIHNEVISVTAPLYKGQYGSAYVTKTEAGYQIGSFFMYEQQGIFQSESEIFTSANQGSSVRPGDVKFKDQNGDGIIDQNDRKHLGSAIPKVTGGLNIAVSYKNFDLTVFFQGAYGQKVFSVLNRDIEGFYRSFNVTERYYLNHWTPENHNNQFPRASWNASGNNTQLSSRFLEDGSYTRLKNIQVGYTLPTGAIKKYGFTALRVYFSGTNLFTWTKYSGMDPEMTVSNNAAGGNNPAAASNSGDGDKANGIDWGTYPSAKSFNVGLNLTF